MRGCALLSVTLATASCSWLQSLDKDQTLDWSAEKLYSEARVALDDSNWTQAKDYYQKLPTGSCRLTRTTPTPTT